jgi:two-component system, chemotaxis family, chemotaxis protein CheY
MDLSASILVVEDSRTMGQIERNLLLMIGFKYVDNTFDGNSALRMLRQREYGLVISDWNMQPMTGHALLKEIRADPGLDHLPVIMVTAETGRESVIAAKEAGANGYIVKPFRGETLKEKIAEVLSAAAERTNR